MTGDLSQSGIAELGLLVSMAAHAEGERERSREKLVFFTAGGMSFLEVSMFVSFFRNMTFPSKPRRERKIHD
jgi:hypothetical protein